MFRKLFYFGGLFTVWTLSCHFRAVSQMGLELVKRERSSALVRALTSYRFVNGCQQCRTFELAYSFTEGAVYALTQAVVTNYRLATVRNKWFIS
jgi:hypothetical protein